MRGAMIGCGKLGYPVSLAWAKFHDMVGYDVSPIAKTIEVSRKYPHLEPGAQKLLDEGSTFRIVDSMNRVIKHADIVFISVQTPHGPEYEGITRMPETRADFDYRMLRTALIEVATAAKAHKKHVTVVVISTVLPGTSARELLPLIRDNEFVSYVYAPMFIAQSTVVEDTMNPEFVLLGIDKSDARGVEEVKAFYGAMHAPEKLRFMSVASAELCKVAYNVALSIKITIANNLMEIADHTGANCDEVTDALAKATDRVISSKYLRGGMPDAGPCHPRDIIALSWLSEKLNLSHDFFGAMVRGREAQAEFIASVAQIEALAAQKERSYFPIVVLGKAYKKGTNLVIGSSAILLKNLLAESGDSCTAWDPHADPPCTFEEPSVFLVATDHDEFYAPSFTSKLPKSSVIVDPWGKMHDIDGCKVVRVGRHRSG